jgi:hypothetical protein
MAGSRVERFRESERLAEAGIGLVPGGFVAIIAAGCKE